LNPRPKMRRRRPLRACLHSRCRSRLETEPTAPAAISDMSRRHASKRHMTASLLIDGRPPSRRLTRGDRSLVIKQRERSQNSQLRIFQRINEELALGTRSTIPHPRRSQVAPRVVSSALARQRAKADVDRSPTVNCNRWGGPAPAPVVKGCSVRAALRSVSCDA
jgi:hypothetical protein